MATSEITVNGKTRTIDADPEMPLLWILRDVLQLTGTKYGCGRGFCGACTVLVDGRAMRACLLTVASLDRRPVTTIEGLGNGHSDGLHPVQLAWIEADVPQCGFCQAGQVMQAVSLLSLNGNPTSEHIDRAMAGNLCRCGTYTRVRKAIEIAMQRREENP